MKKICPVCGKEFEAKYRQRKYCSFLCYYKKTYKKPRKLKWTEYVCAECGEKFLSLTRKKYCSSECYIKGTTRNLNTPFKKICPVCGKEFDGKYSKKFCSRECSTTNKIIKIFVHLKAVDEEYTFKTLRQAVNFLSVFTKYDTAECIELLKQRKNKIGEYDCFY